MTKTKTPPLENLSESLNLVPGPVDRETGTISDVKLNGIKSKNGRTYLKEALAKALHLYEGAAIFVDHGEGQRSYRDKIGRVVNPSLRDDGVYGDLKINRGADIFEQLMFDAENKTPGIGMSHNSIGRCRRTGTTVVVEEIIKIESVDLVSTPATTNSLFEQTETITNENDNQEDETMDYSQLTLEQLKAERPGIVEDISRPLTDLIAEQEALITTLKATAEARDMIESIDKLVTDSGHTKAELGDAFCESCYSMEVDKAKPLIEERAAQLKVQAEKLEEQTPTSGGKGGGSSEKTPEQWRESIITK